MSYETAIRTLFCGLTLVELDIRVTLDDILSKFISSSFISLTMVFNFFLGEIFHPMV